MYFSVVLRSSLHSFLHVLVSRLFGDIQVVLVIDNGSLMVPAAQCGAGTTRSLAHSSGAIVTVSLSSTVLNARQVLWLLLFGVALRFGIQASHFNIRFLWSFASGVSLLYYCFCLLHIQTAFSVNHCDDQCDLLNARNRLCVFTFKTVCMRSEKAMLVMRYFRPM